MDRGFLLFRCALLGVLLFFAPLAADDSLEKESLDLPGSASSNVDDHEEAPEVLILHGAAYQGHGFVFVGAGTG